MKFSVTTIVLAVTCASLPVFGNTDFEETTITATRMPAAVSDTLSYTTVITRQDIDRVQATDLFELLTRAAGVSFVRNGGRGSATSLLLRGNQSDHTLVLIDGIRTGSATLGSASLSALNLASVERIELVRGPKSSLYGADAIGGVLNIITRKVTAPLELSLKTSYGSNKTSENTLAIGGSRGAFSAQLVANVFNTNGIDNTESKAGVNGDNDAFRNNTLSFISRYQASTAFTAQLSYNANDGESEYDSDCTDSTSFDPVLCEIYSVNFVDTLAVAIDWQFSPQLTARIQAGQSRDESENLADNLDLSTTFSGGEFNTKKRESTWLLQYTPNEAASFIAGVDYLDNIVSGSTDYDESSRYNKAAFVQTQFDLNDFALALSTRYDDNEQFGEEQTSSAQLSYNLKHSNRIVVSYGEAFKAPTFNDLYFPGFGIPDLKPESAATYEISYRADYDNHRVALSAYHSEIENLIQYNPATFSTDQTAEAKITGVDGEFATEISAWLVNINANYMLPKNEVNDELLRRRSRIKFALDLDRPINNKLTIGYSFVTEGGRYDDVANEDRLGGYSLSNLRATFDINKNWSTKLRVNNVLDKRYHTSRSFSLGRYENIGREIFLDIEFHPHF